MRYIHKICIALGLLAASAACQRDIVPQVDTLDGEGIVLKLETGDMDLQTKAGTRPGNDDGSDFNENSLGSSVDIFFFPEDAADNTSSVKNLSVTIKEGGYVQIPVTIGDLYTIFGSTAAGSMADVYVVANYDGATTIDHTRHYTLGELKNLQLQKASWITFPQEYFVMTGKASITLSDPSGNTPASGVVNMRRIASKLSFKMTVASEIVVENTTRDANGEVIERSLDRWTPVEDAMTVYLQYGMNYARLGGQALKVPSNPKGAGATDSLFTYDANKLVKTTATKDRTRIIIDALEKIEDGVDDQGNPTYSWNLETHKDTIPVPVYETRYNANTAKMGPFYSYPVTWDPGVQTEPFLKLIIPWNNGSRTKYYYYKIPFSGTSLEANNWYEITLDVQVLGGEDATPVPLTASYKVVDWVQGSEAQTETVAARYLSVPRTEWIMYNQDSLEIPITSSHDVQIVGYQVKSGGTAVNNAFAAADKYDADGNPRSGAWVGADPSIYNPFTATLVTSGVTESTTVGTINAAKPNFNDNTLGTPVPTVVNASSWFDEAEVTRESIILRHTLNNDLSTSNYDVAPYWIMLRLRHKDAPDTYYKDILIEQRPAIYIEPNQNPDNGSTSNVGAHKGYVYVNNGQNTNNSYWYVVRGLDGGNKNVNMYVIHASVLDASSSYLLGDPRSETIDNLNYTFSSATALYGTTPRGLTYYYPTQETAAVQNFIAPTLRVASSYGVCGNAISKDNAKRRCASYQEAGYPAGRWRVPTRAEVEFITTLSSQGVIPTLFNVGSQYWCATGAVTPNNNGTLSNSNSSTAYVRCVYDEWFWMDTTNPTVSRTQFTWGDQPLNTVVRTKALY